MSADLEMKVTLDSSEAKAGAQKLKTDMAKVGKDMAANTKASQDVETEASKRAFEARRQVAMNLAEAQIKLARRVQDQEMINVTALKRARVVAADEAIKGQAKIGDAFKRVASDSVASLGKIGVSSRTLKSTLADLATATISVSVVQGIATAIAGAMKGANDESDRQLDKLRETKNLISDIAAMTGSKEGASDAEVQKHINVRTASGLDQAEARAFSLEFHGASEAAVGVNISEKEQKRAEPMLARLAESQGDGAETAAQVGKLGGLIAGLDKIKDAEELLGKTAQTVKVLSEGVGENPVLIKQLAQVMGAYTAEDGKSLFRNTPELASHIATASKINPEQSGEIIKSTARVVRGFSEQWAPLLKKAGIGETDSYSDSSRKLFAHLEGVEKSGRRLDAYLSEEGVDAAGATHIQSMYKYRATTEKSLALNGRPMTGAEAKAEIDKKFATDNRLQTDMKQARLDESKLHGSMPLQFAKPIELEAETRLQKQGLGADSTYGAIRDWATGMYNGLGGLTGGIATGGMSAQEFGHQINREAEMRKIVEARGQTVPQPAEDGILSTATKAAFAPLQALGLPLDTPMSPERRAWFATGGATSTYSALGAEHDAATRMQGEMAGPGGDVNTPPAKRKEVRNGDNPFADRDMLFTWQKLGVDIGKHFEAQPKPIQEPPRPLVSGPPPNRRR